MLNLLIMPSCHYYNTFEFKIKFYYDKFFAYSDAIFVISAQHMEVLFLAKKIKRQNVLERLAEIAFGSSNDIVKLAFVGSEQETDILDSLDLTMLSEIKHSQNGSVEVKLIDRLKVIELLLRELEEPESRKPQGAEALFLAMDKAAAERDRDAN